MPKPKPKSAALPPNTVRSRHGKPEHVPTNGSRERVMQWSGGGIEQRMIAASLHISHSTLRKHYRRELDLGKAEMDGLAVSTMFRSMQDGGAVGAKTAEFWARYRMGWTETIKTDDGKPANIPMKVMIEYVGDAGPPVKGESAPRTGSRLPNTKVELKG